MITFKQFLLERAENMRAYRKIFKSNQGALVGFEVEVFIPRDHDIAQDGPQGEKRASTSIRNFDTFEEFETYFNIDRSTQREIDDDFESWIDDQKQAFVKDNLTDDNSEEELESEFEDMKYDKYSWRDWFNDNFRDSYDFVNSYSLEPRYGWETENGRDSRVYDDEESEIRDNWKDDIGHLIADSLQRRYLKGKTVVYDKKGVDESGAFVVMADSSIEADEGERAGYGAEIVTPPLPAKEAIACLSRIFDFIEDEGLKTNHSTGLHINISIPNIKRLDPVKLVLMMGDEHVLRQFGRVGNAMAKPQMRLVRDSIERAVATGRIPASSSEVGELLGSIAERVLKAGKYNSVNFDKLALGYLEFRSAGNSNYHQDLTTVENLVGRWMSAMDTACDPEKDKNVYLKRLAKVFSENWVGVKDEDMSLQDLFKKHIPGGYLNPIYRWNTVNRQHFTTAVSNLVQQPFNATPSVRQIKEFRMLLKANAVSAEDILAVSDDKERATKFLSAFKVM